MILLSGLFGATSGAFMSTVTNNLPTGPVIVLVATALFIISIIFAPKRGLLMKGMNLTKLRTIIFRTTSRLDGRRSFSIKSYCNWFFI